MYSILPDTALDTKIMIMNKTLKQLDLMELTLWRRQSNYILRKHIHSYGSHYPHARDSPDLENCPLAMWKAEKQNGSRYGL